MFPPAEPTGLKLCMLYSWQTLHELVAALKLIHSPKSREGWRHPPPLGSPEDCFWNFEPRIGMCPLHHTRELVTVFIVHMRKP